MALTPTEAFDYVVGTYEQAKIAFGTKSERDTLPRKGTNRFTSAYTPLAIDTISPTLYDVEKYTSMYNRVLNKVSSNRGSGGLYSSEPRFKLTYEFGPTATTYDVSAFPAKSVPNKTPFNSAVPRFIISYANIPGPGSYEVDVLRDRRIRFWHSFGGRMVMDPAVDIKCVDINMDICAVCKLKLTGDYWHLKNKEFLCRPCKAKQHGKSSRYVFWKLEQFRKIRDCSSMHSHEGTNAAIVIMSPMNVHKLRTREAYVSQYFRH